MRDQLDQSLSRSGYREDLSRENRSAEKLLEKQQLEWMEERLVIEAHRQEQQQRQQQQAAQQNEETSSSEEMETTAASGTTETETKVVLKFYAFNWLSLKNEGSKKNDQASTSEETTAAGGTTETKVVVK